MLIFNTAEPRFHYRYFVNEPEQLISCHEIIFRKIDQVVHTEGCTLLRICHIDFTNMCHSGNENELFEKKKQVSTYY